MADEKNGIDGATRILEIDGFRAVVLFDPSRIEEAEVIADVSRALRAMPGRSTYKSISRGKDFSAVLEKI